MHIIFDDLYEFSEVVIRCHETAKKNKCSYCPFYDRCTICDPECRCIQAASVKPQVKEEVCSTN